MTLKELWKRLKLAAHLVNECLEIRTDRAQLESAKAERRNLNRIRAQRHAKQ